MKYRFLLLALLLLGCSHARTMVGTWEYTTQLGIQRVRFTDDSKFDMSVSVPKGLLTIQGSYAFVNNQLTMNAITGDMKLSDPKEQAVADKNKQRMMPALLAAYNKNNTALITWLSDDKVTEKTPSEPAVTMSRVAKD